MEYKAQENVNYGNKGIVKQSWLEKLKKKKQRKINSWILGETLGMGGYSKVKLGVHEKTGLKAALKIMFADAETKQMSASKIKQLTRELKVMQKVKHKNVIELVEYDQNAQYPASNGEKAACILVVLEFAPGGELFDYLMFTGRFNEIATRTYFHQLINGLDAIHSQGIAHRDLKPENLLLDSHCNLKIADFGFATEFQTDDGQEKKMQTACGTKGYLAPELLKGKKYTHKCDIFALGIILFTTYAGFPPFQNAVESDWWWDKLSKGWKYIVASEKQKHERDKNKHISAGTKKIELFWKAHERTRQFDKILKNLLERMLHPYGEYRYDIKHIKKHPWYNGKIYSQIELKKYLQQRVKTVVKERAIKIKKQLQEQGVTSVEKYNRRDPTSNAQHKESPMEIRAKELDPKDEFSKYTDHVKDDLFVNTFYQFFTYAPPAQVAARIERIADRAGAQITISPKNNITLIRCAVIYDDKGGDEDVVFACKQFLVDDKDYTADDNDSKDADNDEDEEDEPQEDDGVETEKRYVVSFKRLKGSHLAYQKAIEDFYGAKEIMAVMDFDNILQ